MSQSNTPIKKRAMQSVTDTPQNISTRIAYIVVAQYLLDIEDADILRLLLELIRNAPGFERQEFYAGRLIKLSPYSGILKGGVLAVKWGVDKSTIWRWTRWLEKRNFIKRTLQHHFSVYSLTNKAIPVIRWPNVQRTKEQPVNPPVNPCIKYKVDSNKGEKAPPSSLPKKIACPECKGRGDLWDVKEQEATTCPTCKGKKLIWREDYEALQEIKKLPPRKLVPIKKTRHILCREN